MTPLVVLAAIVAGGAAAMVRYLVGLAVRTRFPWAVLLVNVVGSGLGGAIVALAETGSLSTDARLVLLGGIAGGLTTFSTFSVESIQLALARRWRAAAANVVLNLALGTAAAVAGYLLAR